MLTCINSFILFYLFQVSVADYSKPNYNIYNFSWVEDQNLVSIIYFLNFFNLSNS